jgi:pyruvate dehydrogenase (quinone)
MGRPRPGTVNLLNGLYDANLDHQPVVAIIGRHKRTALDRRSQQDGEIDYSAQRS